MPATLIGPKTNILLPEADILRPSTHVFLALPASGEGVLVVGPFGEGTLEMTEDLAQFCRDNAISHLKVLQLTAVVLPSGEVVEL